MQQRYHKSYYRFLILLVGLIALLPMRAAADGFAQLKSRWQCQAGGERINLEFRSSQKLLYNGIAYAYQLAPGMIVVQEEEGLASYSYVLSNDALMVVDAEGSGMKCQRVKVAAQSKGSNKSVKKAPKPGAVSSTAKGWPPPYTKPRGTVDENNPGAAALLYKFAGRWDHVTTNTLTNIFLKPDGTYEQAYEAGYSGVFKDQGGYQTGNWGVTGAQNDKGRWRVEGNLR